jgi:hypothetical protein
MTALIVRVMAGQTPEGSLVRQLLDSLTFDRGKSRFLGNTPFILHC